MESIKLESQSVTKEILKHIFSYLDQPKDILPCREVCETWKSYIDNEFFKMMCMKQTNLKSFSTMTAEEKEKLDLPWFIFYTILVHDPFEQDLIKNGWAKDALKHWHAKGYWFIEEIPTDRTTLPECEIFSNSIKCFLSAKSGASKSQIIDLRIHGLSDIIMDELLPTVTINAWTAIGTDVVCDYFLTIGLYNQHYECLCKEERKVHLTKEWTQVTIDLEIFTPGVRFIKITHSQNLDSNRPFLQYITGTEVKLSIPKECELNWNRITNRDYWTSRLERIPLYEFIVNSKEWDLLNCPWFAIRELFYQNSFEKNLVSHKVVPIGVNRQTPDEKYGYWMPVLDIHRFTEIDLAREYVVIAKAPLVQIINLRYHGFFDFILDMVQPKIEIYTMYPDIRSSKWFKKKFQVKMGALLLDEDEQVLQKKIVTVMFDQIEIFGLPRLLCEFENYGFGVRYVKLLYEGQFHRESCAKKIKEMISARVTLSWPKF